MTIPILFKQYIWLVNTIYRAKRITLAEINERWQRTEMSEGMPLSRTTFNRHKEAIEDIFGIFIDCDRRDGYRYFIGNEEVLRENSVQNWMLSTLTVNNIISESLSLQNRIVLEDIPSDGEHLELVIGNGSEPVHIVLRAYGKERFYLRDLPLHHTQKEIQTADEQGFTDFKIFLRPTTDFKGKLLSRGACLKVLAPNGLPMKSESCMRNRRGCMRKNEKTWACTAIWDNDIWVTKDFKK